MARLLVLRFEDDEEADEFVNSSIMMSPIGTDYMVTANFVESATVEGMFQAPTKFCDCQYRGDGFRHSGKHNWWLHFGCGRPRPGWGNNFRTIVGFGKDLLEKPSRNTQERIDMVGQRCPECGQAREGYE